MTILPPNIIFPHATHINQKIQCTECHKNVPKKRIATRSDLPTMGQCLDCHQKMDAPTACTTCHLAAEGGRIQTNYAEGTLKPAKHHAFALHDGHFSETTRIPRCATGTTATSATARTTA